MLKNFQFVDLTHPLTPAIPTWDRCCGFEHEITLDYDDCKTDPKFRTQQIKMHAGIGTHMDAPAHCIPGGLTIDQLPLDQLITECIVIDLSKQAHENFKITPEVVITFEKEVGKISKNSFVIFYTGWEDRWHDPKLYINNHIFPFLSEDVATLLLERKVAGIGVDTLSPDRPDSGFPMHKLMLGNSKYIVENIANAHKLPPIGSYTFALPLYFTSGTEAPIRCVALIKKKL